MVVFEWLASFAVETPMRNGNEMRLPPLPPRVAAWAERVLSARAQVGDPRIRRQMGPLCVDADVGCPFGCRDGVDGPAAFTWWHVAFACGNAQLRVARATWLSRCQACAPELNAGGPHGQLGSVIALLSDWQTGMRASVSAVEAVRLRDARKVLGAAVDPLLKGKTPPSARRAAARMVVAGLELQVLADELSCGLMRQVRATVGGRRRLRAAVQLWRQRACSAGPAHAAMLARLRMAREVAAEQGSRLPQALSFALAAPAPSGHPAPIAQVAVQYARVSVPVILPTAIVTASSSARLPTVLVTAAGPYTAARLVQHATAAVRPGLIRGGGTKAPATAWYSRLLLCRWRAAVERMWRDDESICLSRSSVGLGALARDVCWRWDEVLRAVSVSAFGFEATAWREQGGAGGWQRWPDGAWRAASALEGEERAARALAVVGGRAAVRREATALAKLLEVRQLAQLEQASWGSASPSATAGIRAWAAQVRDGRRASRQFPALLRRKVENVMISRGLMPDGRGRMAVERLIGFRGSGRNKECLVRWSGVDLESGERRADEWLPASRLTGDLRPSVAQKRRVVPPVPAPALQADGSRRRVSPRFAGEAPAPPLAPLVRTAGQARARVESQEGESSAAALAEQAKRPRRSPRLAGSAVSVATERETAAASRNVETRRGRRARLEERTSGEDGRPWHEDS